MHVPSLKPTTSFGSVPVINLRYIFAIALVAALGGLLFGYDWIVIGGARPFYEAYFQLTSSAQIGWANSCALVGCFIGSLGGGRISDLFGRKCALLTSAILFTVSSVLTGWSYHFAGFVAWRIVGGLAIGLASNVTPTYIAEVSPADWRGRLVSLNQLAIVVGILTAQIVNWQITKPSAPDMTAAALSHSWNAIFGWRWMFTAVAFPSALFLCLLPFIPESPRWLMSKHFSAEARKVLSKIGGKNYSLTECSAIAKSLSGATGDSHWKDFFQPPVFRLISIGVGLVVLQQASGINTLFNYAAEVYKSAGYSLNEIMLNIVASGAINLLFTLIALALVDRLGRRQLMIWGCVAICACHIGASYAYGHHITGSPILILSLGAIAAYAMSLAPVTWVLISELFPNRYRSVAVSVSVAALWASSFVVTYTFPVLNEVAGPAKSFLVYAIVCGTGAVFVKVMVPETRGKTLEQIGESYSGK